MRQLSSPCLGWDIEEPQSHLCAQPTLCLTPGEKDERQERPHHRAPSYLFLQQPLSALRSPPLLLWMLPLSLLLQLAHSPLRHVQLCLHLCQLKSKWQTLLGSLGILKGTAPSGCWARGIKRFQIEWGRAIWIPLLFGGKRKLMTQISVKFSGKY